MKTHRNWGYSLNICWHQSFDTFRLWTQSEDSWGPRTLERGPHSLRYECRTSLQMLILVSYKNCREMPDFFKLWIIVSSWSWLNGLLRSVNTSICPFSNFFPLKEKVIMIRNHSPDLSPTNSNALGHWAERGKEMNLNILNKWDYIREPHISLMLS